MSSWTTGLDIAYRALQAEQQAIDVVNHNIANANTPGYSRQVANMATTQPAAVISLTGEIGQMGTGVRVTHIERQRSSFTDLQIRDENYSLGQWEKTRDALQQVEVVFNEPSDAGLNSLMSRFWQSWQDLTNSPQDAGARRALVEQADSLAVSVNRVYSQLTSIQNDTDNQIKLKTDSVNQIAQQVASLNVKISQAEQMGLRANDLRDQRDLLIDDLSRVVRLSYYETADGAVNIFLGSHTLVVKDRVDALANGIDVNGFATVTWDSDGSPVSITDGELYGLQQARDVDVPAVMNDLDALASGLITRINALHTAGFGLDNTTNLNFFNGTGASTIAVNPTLKSNPEKVATASAANSIGDNSVALGISGLQTTLTMSGNTSTFGQFFASMMSRLGVDSQRADMMANNQKLLVDHLKRQRETLSGVSLDEETTKLIEYQRAYEAAARVINVVDEMLDLLINRVGLVGR